MLIIFYSQQVLEFKPDEFHSLVRRKLSFMECLIVTCSLVLRIENREPTSLSPQRGHQIGTYAYMASKFQI